MPTCHDGTGTFDYQSCSLSSQAPAAPHRPSPSFAQSSPASTTFNNNMESDDTDIDCVTELSISVLRFSLLLIRPVPAREDEDRASDFAGQANRQQPLADIKNVPPRRVVDRLVTASLTGASLEALFTPRTQFVQFSLEGAQLLDLTHLEVMIQPTTAAPASFNQRPPKQRQDTSTIHSRSTNQNRTFYHCNLPHRRPHRHRHIFIVGSHLEEQDRDGQSATIRIFSKDDNESGDFSRFGQNARDRIATAPLHLSVFRERLSPNALTWSEASISGQMNRVIYVHSPQALSAISNWFQGFPRQATLAARRLRRRLSRAAGRVVADHVAMAPIRTSMSPRSARSPRLWADSMLAGPVAPFRPICPRLSLRFYQPVLVLPESSFSTRVLICRLGDLTLTNKTEIGHTNPLSEPGSSEATFNPILSHSSSIERPIHSNYLTEFEQIGPLQPSAFYLSLSRASLTALDLALLESKTSPVIVSHNPHSSSSSLMSKAPGNRLSATALARRVLEVYRSDTIWAEEQFIIKSVSASFE
ncbi:unnamed protein product, partial [Protopolystoma xenopodis]